MKKIKNCKKCELCENQNPLVEEREKNTDIMFLGVSAVLIKEGKIKNPLGEDTRTGKLIKEIEILGEKEGFKSNLVKCLPLDEINKIRKPNKREMKCCYENYLYEIEIKKPKKIVLLGRDVAEFILGKDLDFPKLVDEFLYISVEKDGIKYLPVHHPSYILRTKINIRERYKMIIGEFIK